MESNKRGENRNAPIQGIGSAMSAFDRARAVQAMNEAMMLGNLAITAFGHVRSSLKALRNAATRRVALR
jgi:hypothetical protein